jgi:outer membrane biosynthesis protein TonB
MTAARCCALLECVGVGMMVIFGGVFSSAFAQNAGQQLPVVVSASVPLYPRTAQLAHIQGTVKIRATTDGKKVSSLDAESGPPMLVQAAEDNLRTWQFEEHKPVTFLEAVSKPGTGL